jgi:hypothetical protein
MKKYVVKLETIFDEDGFTYEGEKMCLIDLDDPNEIIFIKDDDTFTIGEIVTESDVIIEKEYIRGQGKIKFAKRKEDNFLKDFTFIKIDVGETVLCDYCNTDYTNDDETTGGILFSGHAVCPLCLNETMKNIKKYREERFIQLVAKEDETFRNFVYRIRKGNI